MSVEYDYVIVYWLPQNCGAFLYIVGNYEAIQSFNNLVTSKIMMYSHMLNTVYSKMFERINFYSYTKLSFTGKASPFACCHLSATIPYNAICWKTFTDG